MSQLLERQVVFLIRDFELKLEIARKNSTPQIENDELHKIFDKVHELVSGQISTIYVDFSLQTLIKIPKAALYLPSRVQIAEFYLDHFRRNVQTEGLFFIKTHVLTAKMLAQKSKTPTMGSAEKLELIRKALDCLKNAIGVIARPSNGGKYSFMAFNITTVVYLIVKDYFRKGFLLEFKDIVKALNDILKDQEDDHDWRGMFSWLLFFCAEDSKVNRSELITILDSLWKANKTKPYFFQEALFRLKVNFASGNASEWSVLQKEIERDPDVRWKCIFTLQSIKIGSIPESQIEKDLTSLMRNLVTGKAEELYSSGTSSQYDILAEAARVAAHFNATSVVEQMLDILKKNKRLSPRAYILIEFTKAEMLIKWKNTQKSKDNIVEDPQMLKVLEVERRQQALAVIQKAVKESCGLMDHALIYEGCLLLWNIGLAFLNEKHKDKLFKPFQMAAKMLSKIESSDFGLRVRLNYEIAKLMMDKSKINDARSYAENCMDLLRFDENIFDGRKVDDLLEAISKRINLSNQKTQSDLEKIETKLQNFSALTEKDQREFLPESLIWLKKQFKLNKGFLEKPFVLENLTQSNDVKTFQQKQLEAESVQNDIKCMNKEELKIEEKKLYKLCMIATDIANMAFDKKMYDLSVESIDCFLSHLEKHIQHAEPQIPLMPAKRGDNNTKHIQAVEPQRNKSKLFERPEILSKAVQLHYLKAQALIRIMEYEGIDFAIQGFCVKPNARAKPENLEQYEAKKSLIVTHFVKGINLSFRAKQMWLIFNGGIFIWNNYMHLLKVTKNDKVLHSGTIEMFEHLFESLKSAIKEVETKKVVNYDMENMIQTYGSVSIIFVKLLEQKADYGRVIAATDDLLLVPLSLQVRKVINSIRARAAMILKSTSNKGKDKNKDQDQDIKNQNSTANHKDQFIFNINFKLETIQNSLESSEKLEDKIKNIKQCFDLLYDFQKSNSDELDVELSCELWTRLASLALNYKTLEVTKMAINCLEFALRKYKTQISGRMMKSFSLAKYLYSKALCTLVELDEAGTDNCETMLFKALQQVLESIDLGIKSKNIKVFDGIKMFYAIVRKLQINFFTAENRKCLLKPIFSFIYYIKLSKETFNDSQNDIQISQMLGNLLHTFIKGCTEKEHWELGNMACNLALEFAHPSTKDRLWMIKVITMTRQGIEMETLFDEIQDCNSELKSQLLQQIAWNSESVKVQYQVFAKAIDLLKKENSPNLNETLLNFLEWMYRNDFPLDNLKITLGYVEEIVRRGNNHDHKFQNIDLGGLAMGGMGADQQNLPNSFRDRLNDFDNKLHNQKSQSEKEKENILAVFENNLNVSESFDVLTNFSVSDGDVLMKVNYIQLILAKNLKQKHDFTKKILWVIRKIFGTIFDYLRIKALQKNVIHSSDLEADVVTEDSVEIQMPATFHEWINFAFSDSFTRDLYGLTDPSFFCKSAFRQPWVSFYYLITFQGEIEEMCSRTEAAMMFKFIELYSLLVLDSKSAQNLSLLFLARLAYKNCETELAKLHVREFLCKANVTGEYFDAEFRLMNHLHENDVLKFQLSGFSSKNKQSFILNSMFDFEFWQHYSEVLYDINEIDYSIAFAVNCIRFFEATSAFDLLGKTQALLGKIHSSRGNFPVAFRMFSAASKNIKLLSSWKVFLQYSTNHFLQMHDFQNCETIVKKFENFITDYLKKDAGQLDVSQANDILAFLKLVNAHSVVEQFKLIEAKFVFETIEVYKENLKHGFGEVLNLLNIFFKMTEKNITRENFKYALVIFHEIFEVFSSIKIFNYDILNQLYVFILIILNFLVQLQALVEESVCKVHDYLPKEFSTKSVNELSVKNDKNNSDRLSLENVSLMNTLNIRLSRFTNLFLQLELFYRDSKFIFPAIEEKYYREKIFGTNTPMFGVFQTMESNENGETNNISSEEYILNYNPRRSNGLIEFNLSCLNKLLSRPNKFVIKEVVMLEKLISSCRKMDLKSLLEIDIKDIMPAFKTNEENELSKLNSLAFIDDEEGVKDFFSKISFVGFEQFFTEEYFNFNRIRLFSAISNNFVTNLWDQITTFTDYQNIKLQKVLYQMYLSESDIRATPRSTFNKLLFEKDVEKWKAFVQQNQFFKNITELSSISNAKDALPKNSVFLILEPDDNFYN